MRKTIRIILSLILTVIVFHILISYGKLYAQTIDSVYVKVDQEAQYYDGIQKMNYIILKNLVYPDTAMFYNVKGKVIVGLTINSDGELINSKIIKGIGYGCDKEALRITGLLKKWYPAIKDGRKVSSYIEIPIKFVLTR